jgi:hypothetical protein
MSGFDERWRALTRAAGRAPEPRLVPLRWEWTDSLATRPAPAERPSARRRGPALSWALPAAVVALLYALALPALEPAWTNVRTLTNPLEAVPRAPTVPSPPVPAPPPLPRPPVTRGSTEVLKGLMKEMQS